MKSLGKKRTEKLSELADACRTAWAVVEDATVEFNAATGALHEFVEEIAAALTEHYDECSDRWRESEAGQQFDAFRSAWSDAEVLDFEPDAPFDLDLVEALPTCAEDV